MDAGPKPTGTYLWRVSEQTVVSHVEPAAIGQGKRAVTGFKIQNSGCLGQLRAPRQTGHRTECIKTFLALLPLRPYRCPRSRPGNRALLAAGGKSGLRRAGCQVTPGGREPTESATENIPPVVRLFGLQVRVKWCGKSAPRGW